LPYRPEFALTHFGIARPAVGPSPGVGRGRSKASFRTRLSVNTIDAAIDAAVAGAELVRAMCYQVADHVRAGHSNLDHARCTSFTTRKTDFR
jgi:hypothetical protein